MSEEEYLLQSVAGRRCERSIEDMEQAARIYITKEVHNHFGDNVIVGLLSDYIRMGREYSDRINSESMQARITELERENKGLRNMLDVMFEAEEKRRQAVGLSMRA